MNAPVVFGREHTLDQVPPRRRSRFLAVAIVLVAVALGVALDEVAHADEERFEPSSRSPRDQVLELAERHFPPELVPWVMATARCESGYDLDAENPKGYVGYDRRLGVRYHFRGPLQVDEVTWSATAWELFGGPLSDPDVSMAMAAWIVQRYGVGHWPVCGRGAGW